MPCNLAQLSARHVISTVCGYEGQGGSGESALRLCCSLDAEESVCKTPSAGVQVMLRKESDWMARQPKARGTKAKARVDSFYELQEKANSGPRMDVAVNLGEVSMARQGNKVLVMKVRCSASQWCVHPACWCCRRQMLVRAHKQQPHPPTVYVSTTCHLLLSCEQSATGSGRSS